MSEGRKKISDDATELQILCMNLKYKPQKVLLKQNYVIYKS